MTLRLKLKFAECEFEAEGPPDLVQAQALTFVKLLGRNIEHVDKMTGPQPPHPAINRIARLQGKVVSANLRGESLERAVLVLLLGQHQLRGKTAIAGTDVMMGLRASGHAARRADHVLMRHAAAGNIVVTGKRRLKRYRLTTDGVQKAQTIAQTLAASAPEEV